MPDFNDLIKQISGEQAQSDPSKLQDPNSIEQPIDPGQQEYDTSGIGFAGDEEKRKKQMDSNLSGERFPGFSDINKDLYVDPESWSPYYINEALVTQAGKNIMFGVGQMIGDYGDIAQVLGSALPGVDMYEGNMLSRALQDMGEDMQRKYTTYVPEEILNPEFKMSTFMNPQFWTTHGARFVPQLVEILATVGLGTLAKKGVQKGAKAALKNVLEEGSESALKKSLKTTTEGVYAGAKGIQEVSGTGKGLIGKMITDRGDLTKNFGNIVSTVAAGTATNLRVSLANAGEIYNTYKDLKDEQGNDLFSREELSQMAAGTFLNNMQYIGLDILSWGLTYGKGASILKNSGIGKFTKKFNKDFQGKYMSGLFSNSVSPLYKKLAKIGGKMATEGFEETIQETHEEWSKMQAYKDVHGSMAGYQGPGGSKNFDSFWDYYMSKENESTLAISAALGGMGAGVFNVKSLVDRNATEAYKMKNRAENLKQLFDKGTKGKIWQDYHIRSQMAELVFEDKGESFVGFTTDLHENGIINDEELETYSNLFDQMAEVKNDISSLNIKGKKAVMTNIMAEQFFNDSIEVEKAKSAKNIETLKRTISNPETLQREMEKEQANLSDKINILSNNAAKAANNVELLISGRKAEPVDFDVKKDQYGQEFITADPTTEDAPDLKESNPSKEKTSLTDRAKQLFDRTIGAFSSILNPQSEQEGEQQQETSEGVAQATDGAIEALNQIADVQAMAKSLTPGESFLVDGQEALVDAIKGTDDNIDSIEYTVPADPNVQDSQPQKKIARLTKNNTFFDDRNNRVLNVQKKAAEQKPSRVSNDDSKTDLDDATYNDFVDKGTVPSGVINNISEKIATNQKLNDRELSVQKEFSPEIEENLKKRQQDEIDAMTDIDENTDIDESEKNYVKKASARTAKKKSLSGESKKFLDSLKKTRQAAAQKADDIFSGDIAEKAKTVKDKVNNIFGARGKEKRNVSSLKKALQNALSTIKEKARFLNRANPKVEVSKQVNEGYINRQLSMVDQDHFFVSQMVGINQNLEIMFPDLQPRAYAVSNLVDSVGASTIGYSLAGSVFIDENSWRQDRVFMHEMSHIYYQLTQDDPTTKVLLKHAMKNQKLVDTVLKRYEDQIMYFDPQTNHMISRGEIIGEYWGDTTKEQRDDEINRLIEAKEIMEVPLEYQPIIAEEIFTHTLEGPLSVKYDKLFDPKDDFRRKAFVKKWWAQLKHRANRLKEDYRYDEPRFLKTLSGEEATEYSSAKQHIITAFQESIAGNDISSSGRFKKIDKQDKATIERAVKINERIKKSVSENLGKKTPKPRPLVDTLEDMDIMGENFDPEATFNVDRLRYLHKASQIIRDFTKNYNIVLKRRFYKENSGKAIDWKNVPTFDGDLLQIKLYQLAKQSDSSVEFIDRIENTSVEELFEFNDFLENVRDDKELFLQGLWQLASNHSSVNSIKTFVDRNGKVSVQNSLNLKEQAYYENALDSIVKAVGSYFANNKSTDGQQDNRYLENFAIYKAAADNIRSGTYTGQDIFDVLNFFTDGRVNIAEIMKKNRININGKNYTVDTAVRAFLDSSNGMGASKDGTKQMDSIKVFPKGGSSYYAPGVRTFIQSLISTNREFTAEYTTIDADGNQTPTRQIDSDLTKRVALMEKDAVTMGKNSFIRKYANISKKAPKGSLSNLLLGSIYDSVQEGKGISLSQFHGIQNQSTGNSTVIKNSNSAEQSLNEFLMFVSTSRISGKKKSSYLMDLGRFSDSPRAYIMEVPRVNLSEIGKMAGNRFIFNPKQKTFVETAYNIEKELGYQGTMQEFQNLISQKIENEITFMEQNQDAATKVSSLSSLYDGNGKLNEKGKNFVAEYVVNQKLNGLYFSEIYLPSFRAKDRDKRAKAATSPKFSMPSSVKIEAIPIVDDYLIERDQDGKTVKTPLTDAAMYMLEEDAKRIESAFGNVMPIGKGIKGLAAGVEYGNKKFSGKNINHKGYIFILNDAVVEDNPKLKGVYQLMKERREVYADLNGNVEENLLSGFPTQLTYAYHVSADKAGTTPQTLVDGNEQTTETGQRFTLDNLNSGNLEGAHETLDNWYWDRGEFMGLSGENFGVQQIMDKETNSSNVPVQMVRALVTNASVNGNIQQAEEMQRLVVELMKDNIDQVKNTLENGTNEDIRKMIVDQMNLEELDPIQRFAIKDDLLSLNVPILREIARNQLSNTIKRLGNKLKAPGTIAQQKPAHFEKKYGKTNGSSELSYYQEKSDGTLTKMEIVLPIYMKNRVKSRQIIVLSDDGTVSSDIPNFEKKYANAKQLSKMDMETFLDNAKKFAQQEARKRNVGIGEIYNNNNKLVGYYVEGDTVIATRIPAHGPQSTGVFEAVDFDKSGASNVQMPHEFALKTTGGDFDGDQVFIQHKGMDAKWDRFIDLMEKHWLSPQMKNEIRLGIDFKEEAEQAIEYVKGIYGDNYSTETSLFTPEDRRKSFNNTLITKGSIGKTANLHGLIGLLSAYGSNLDSPITVDRIRAEQFQDSQEESRTINSAKIFNIILDNAKYGYADLLGINEHTVNYAVILRNLGFDLGQIGAILNSKVVKDWADIKSNQKNVFSDNFSTYNIEEMVRQKNAIKSGKNKPITIDTKNINSAESQNSIINLLTSLDGVTAQINKISAIMSGHNTIEGNPFLLQEQINDFENIINNVQTSGFNIDERFKNNPLVQNYLETAKINLEQQRKIDPVYRKDGSFVYDSIINSVTRTLSKNEKHQLYNDIELFFTSRLLGHNNINQDYFKKLVDPNSADSIFSKLESHINQLKREIIERDENYFFNSKTAFKNNLLFSKGLSYNLRGNNKFVSLNSSFFKENISGPLRQRMIDEFNALPVDLKNDLMLYDLMQNGWKGPKSLFTVFDPSLKKAISTEANSDINTKNLTNLNFAKRNLLMERILDKNPEFIVDIKGNPFYVSPKGDSFLSLKNIPSGIFNKIKKGEVTIFRNGNTAYMFTGWKDTDMPTETRDDKALNAYVAKMAPTNMLSFKIGQFSDNIGIVSIADDISGTPHFENDRPGEENTMTWEEKLERAKKKREDDIRGREARSDYYRFHNTLQREEFDAVMEYEQSVGDRQKESLYDAYLTEKTQADKDIQTITPEFLQTKTTDELVGMYQEYGEKNRFAYANVLRNIVLELSNRVAAEQSQLTGKYDDGKDISPIKKWMMSNNIPSNHPAVQGLVRNLEIEYKKYVEEKNKYVSKINDATDQLYDEKFGFKINKRRNLMDFLKSVYYSLFANRKDFYQQLYGNLLVVEKIQKKTGPETNMRFKDEATIEREYNEGNLSPAEYNFYKTVTAVTKELKPHVLQDKKGRQDYIPHTAPDMMEKLWRRGLLGLAVNSKTIEEKIYDVRMTATNPVTGITEKNVSFKDIENWYNVLSKGQNVPLAKSLEYVKLKRKAIKLYRSGKNENGTPIHYSKISMGTAIGDVFMDRFSSSRSVSAQDFPSMDLNKAFVDYVNSALFVHGNGTFRGMKRMLPFVDGALAQAERKNNPNMEKYVDKIWKQYFLSGKKQNTIPTPAAIEAVGITSDKVVDFITKGSLMYWLGWKGLAIGQGFYAIGNVLIGKYNNIKNAGGGTWAKGEKRFWLGKSGTFDIRDPFRGVREANQILKNAGFMDINVYDTVNVQAKTSLEKVLSGFALAPMIYSEKWIQGVHFLGMLSDEEWETLANGGAFSTQRLTEMENEVKISHGKGYQATDQRMIQMYSWGRNMMQFSRYIPTMFYDRMGKEDIDIYGKKYIGSYRAFWKVIQKMASGEISPTEFAKYRNKLDTDERKRLDSALMGFGMMSALIAVNTFAPTRTGDKLFWDANVMFDSDKLAYKTIPPSVNMLTTLSKF